MSDPLSTEAKPMMQLAEANTFEDLRAQFNLLIDAVEVMMDAEQPSGEESACLMEEAQEALSAPAKVDQVCALMAWYEAREKVLRSAVQAAEKRAREHASFVKHLKDGIEFYMLEKGIVRIEGLAHKLCIYKKPNQLVVENEDLVPDEFFDVKQVEVRELNKDRLLVALQEKEIPGATLLKDQRRLQIR